MSCWVVPTVAAEIWGTSVQEVLRRIDSAEIAVRHDNGWTFVDVAPQSPMLTPPIRPLWPKPTTFVPIPIDDLIILEDQEEEPTYEEELLLDEEESEELIGGQETEHSTFRNWRNARQRTSRLRLAPPTFST